MGSLLYLIKVFSKFFLFMQLFVVSSNFFKFATLILFWILIKFTFVDQKKYREAYKLVILIVMTTTIYSNDPQIKR